MNNKQYFQKWRKDNKQKILSYKREYYALNKDKAALYREKHREQAKEYSKRYRQKRKLSGKPNGIARRWFDKISARDGSICKICNTKEDLSINHIIPKCVGGEYSYENLEILCRKCNIKEYHRLVQKALKVYFNK